MTWAEYTIPNTEIQEAGKRRSGRKRVRPKSRLFQSHREPPLLSGLSAQGEDRHNADDKNSRGHEVTLNEVRKGEESKG